MSALFNIQKLGDKYEGSDSKKGSGRYGAPATNIPISNRQSIKYLIPLFQSSRQQQTHSNVAEVMDYQHSVFEVNLPLFSSKVVAGFPSPAEDHVEQRLQPNSYLIENEIATFCLRVMGDSMIGAGIFDKDVLIVDRSRHAQIGDIVLAVLDGEFTVKTLGHSKQGPRLIPANSNYPIIEIKDGQQFEIWGVVTGSMRKFK